MTEYGIRELKHRVKGNKLLTFEERKYISKALEEIQQYRTIGTVEQLKTLQEDYWKLNEISKEYSAVGTIEEFKALKEKNEPLEVKEIHVDEYYCPACGSENSCDNKIVRDKFCSECGHALFVNGIN